jgi:hypothetical protein
MKIGDLVKLSAYGRRLFRARWISNDDIGLVIKVMKLPLGAGSVYVVQWVNSTFSFREKYDAAWGNERTNTRNDLAYVKLSPGSSAG